MLSLCDMKNTAQEIDFEAALGSMTTTFSKTILESISWKLIVVKHIFPPNQKVTVRNEKAAQTQRRMLGAEFFFICCGTKISLIHNLPQMYYLAKHSNI